MFLQVHEVFNHAHVVFCTIAFVQPFETLTRKIHTFKTEANPPIPKQVTAVAHMQAVLVPRPATLTILPVKALLFQVIYLRLISDTQAAVHATRRYEFFSVHDLVCATCFG